jgi:hypothetical protein
LGNPFFGKGYNFPMTITVSLRDLVGELQILPNEGTVYLNKITGKIIMVTDDEVAMAEMFDEIEEESEDRNEESGGESPDLELDYYQDIKKIIEGDARYLQLPSKFDINEYEMMERFSLYYPNEKISNILSEKIRGSGAFRRFKDTIYEYGIENDWFKYRDEAYKEIVIAWLESNDIAYVDDMNEPEQGT